MEIAILIPARAGSKRIPNKNIKLLGKHPLLAWSIITAKDLGLPVWVSTDSDHYAEIAKSYGAEVLFRPEWAANDSAGDYEVISHFLSQVRTDIVVYLRPTTPFRSSGVVLGAIKLMSFKGGYDSLRSVEEMSESAYKCFRIKNGILKPLMDGIDVTDRTNQELERTYHPNGYVDIVRLEIVERGANERFLWGEGRYAYITRKVIEIDTEADWQYAEWQIQKRG